MSALRLSPAVLLTFSLFLIGCSADRTLQSITVSPSYQEMGSPSQTVQFRATAIYTKGTHPTTTRDVTSEVEWNSSNPAVATINASGLATAVAGGSTEISATMGGSLGVVAGTAQLKVEYAGTDAHEITSLSIIPSNQDVSNVGETAQYLAIGSFNSTPVTQDVTNLVRWVSSDVRVATINSAGLATAVNSGNTTITAMTQTGATITATATMNVNVTGGGGVKLPTLTVYIAGQGEWISVVSNPVGINCSPQNQAGCTGTFPVGTSITLTATASAGSQVGGFSSNCTLSEGTVGTAAVACNTTSDTNNDSVGVIFNLNP